MKHIVSLLLALLMTLSPAFAQTTEDAPFATVNGEVLPYSEYAAIESAYLYQYEAAGVDLTDASVYAYVQDLAETYAIEQLLVDQDMRAQGCYDFDEQTETWFAEQGKAAYDAALAEVMESMRTAETSDDELMVYALAYAKTLGVTEQTYTDFYRTQYASTMYYDWLLRDQPITDADVQAAYDERVAASKALYEDDIAAFEHAVSSGEAVWYKPEGYRSVLQILLSVEGASPEEKLLSAQPTVEIILSRLEQGESFESLIREFGTDTAFQDESFFATGYQVHTQSIVWAEEFVSAAFSADMAHPGCWSQPFASELGVHILYYLSDNAGGAIGLTEAIHDMLAYDLYVSRYQQKQRERLDELAASAEIVFH